MEELIATYGYWAILIGTFLEGETILIIAGYAAHRGWLELTPTILAAFVGSAAGDQLYYFIGRRHGRAFLDKRPRWQQNVARAQSLLHRHQSLVILGCRFLYGLRIVIPFAIGMSGVRPLRFILLNLTGAAVWAVSFGVAGYYLGEAVQRVLGHVERYESYGLVAIAVVGLLVWLVHFWRRKKRRVPGASQSLAK